MPCSMSAYMDGPWKCTTYNCGGRGEDCDAPTRNEGERLWLERQAVDNAWLAHYGLPALTIRDARSVVGNLASRAHSMQLRRQFEASKAARVADPVGREGQR